MWCLRNLPGASTVNRLVPVVVGSLLVGAALLKADRLLTESPASHTYLFELLLIEVELFLGLAMVLAIRLHLLRLAALLLFAAFAIAAFVQAVAGARSCACLGRLEANPWIMASLDLCVLAILWWWKPIATSSSTQSLRGALFLGCCAFPALLPFLILSERGQVRADSGLVISPSQEDLGDVLQGATREFALFLKNPHERAVSVYEVESSCPCLQ